MRDDADNGLAAVPGRTGYWGLVSMSVRVKRSVWVMALLPETASGPWCPSPDEKASVMVRFSF
jgi:hypothetical protein